MADDEPRRMSDARLEDLLVPKPDDKAVVSVLAGAVGVGRANHRPVARAGLHERAPLDSALSLLCGAWAAWWLDPSTDRSLATRELVFAADMPDAVERLARDGWTAPCNDGRVVLRDERVVEAIERLCERYGDGERADGNGRSDG